MPSEHISNLSTPEAETPTVRPVRFGPLGFSNQATSGTGGRGDLLANQLNMALLLDVPLRVTVELGRARMLIKDVLNLCPGTIVELDKLAGEPVDILVNDRLLGRGEVVVVDEKFGVRVTEILAPEAVTRATGVSGDE